MALADPDLVVDVRIIGVRPDDLDLATDEIEARGGGALLPRPRPRRVRGGAPGQTAATPEH